MFEAALAAIEFGRLCIWHPQHDKNKSLKLKKETGSNQKKCFFKITI